MSLAHLHRRLVLRGVHRIREPADRRGLASHADCPDLVALSAGILGGAVMFTLPVSLAAREQNPMPGIPILISARSGECGGWLQLLDLLHEMQTARPDE